MTVILSKCCHEPQTNLSIGKSHAVWCTKMGSDMYTKQFSTVEEMIEYVKEKQGDSL